MHDTAALTGNAFFRCYGDPLHQERFASVQVLDVGSLNVNGTLNVLEAARKAAA